MAYVKGGDITANKVARTSRVVCSIMPNCADVLSDGAVAIAVVT